MAPELAAAPYPREEAGDLFWHCVVKVNMVSVYPAAIFEVKIEQLTVVLSPELSMTSLAPRPIKETTGEGRGRRGRGGRRRIVVVD